jgi:hypothetical protein
MTKLKKLKKELSKLKNYRAHLPRLIDCSEVNGDEFFTREDLIEVEKQIEKLQKQINDNK